MFSLNYMVPLPIHTRLLSGSLKEFEIFGDIVLYRLCENVVTEAQKEL